jgi:methylglutaconyl-CoA hydratase
MRRAAAASEAANLADAERFAAMLQAVAACPKPTLARIQGLALGGGVGLACACDIAVASSEAKFAVSEARLGILPAVIGPYLINAVGLRQARRLALTAGRFGAAEALQMGLLHDVVAPDLLDQTVEQWVGELLASGPQAQREIKHLFAQLAVGPVSAEVRALTAQTIARVRGGPEAREGFAAFVDKRPAAWIPQSSSKA